MSFKVTKVELAKILGAPGTTLGAEAMFGPGIDLLPGLPTFEELPQEAKDAWERLSEQFNACVLKSAEHLPDDHVLLEIGLNSEAPKAEGEAA